MHFSVDHSRFIWPPGLFGEVLQICVYGGMIAMAVVVTTGATVAAYLYLHQNKPPQGDSNL